MIEAKIRTSDIEWAEANGVSVETEADGFALVTIKVPSVERVSFCGREMIRFDIGPKAPRDHNRHAMYPATYLVA